MIKRKALTRLDAKGRKRYAYEVRLRDGDGREYLQTFHSRAEAEGFVEAQRTDRRRGVWTDPRLAHLSVEELGALWLVSNPAKRRGTRSRERTIINLHLQSLRARAIGSVTQPDVQNLVNAWAQLQAPRTVRRHYGVLRAMFGYAVDADYLGRSPCRNIKLPALEPLRRQLPDAAGLGPGWPGNWATTP
jgi:hypothetical protein